MMAEVRKGENSCAGSHALLVQQASILTRCDAALGRTKPAPSTLLRLSPKPFPHAHVPQPPPEASPGVALSESSAGQPCTCASGMAYACSWRSTKKADSATSFPC